jgi:hypothetical protein
MELAMRKGRATRVAGAVMSRSGCQGALNGLCA